MFANIFYNFIDNTFQQKESNQSTVESFSNISHMILHCLEVILSHNVEVNYISARFNLIADFLSHHPKGEPSFPDIPKFFNTKTPTTEVNVIFNGEIIDTQLVSMAEEAMEDNGYQQLIGVLLDGGM